MIGIEFPSPAGYRKYTPFDRYAPEEHPVYRSIIQVEKFGSGGATC